MNGEIEPDRQGVDHGYTHTMQAARYFIRIAVKLPASVQLSHNDFCRGATFCGMLADRNAAAIIGDFCGPIRVQGHGDLIRMSGQSFVNRIVDDFVNHMVQARAVIGVTNVHAGALADRFKALQDFDRVGPIFRVIFNVVCHWNLSVGVIRKFPSFIGVFA